MSGNPATNARKSRIAQPTKPEEPVRFSGKTASHEGIRKGHSPLNALKQICSCISTTFSYLLLNIANTLHDPQVQEAGRTGVHTHHPFR